MSPVVTWILLGLGAVMVYAAVKRRSPLSVVGSVVS